MIQRIFATVIIAAFYFFLAVQSTLQSGASDAAAPNSNGRVARAELQSAHANPALRSTRNTNGGQEISVSVSSPVAQFNENGQSWTLSATVMQIKDVSIYGKPGMIAQIEFIREGEARYAWTVIQIDDFDLANEIDALRVGQEIVLEIDGPYVSAQGVNWAACPHMDRYCKYAAFIEGGFPISEDYNGLTVCPSNRLIYSGDASSDWVNGMLAWKISVED